MGGLLPNPNDLQVIAQLDERFSGDQLIWLRGQCVSDPMFDAQRSLRRAAWRLKIAPTTGNKPAARWSWFLGKGLSQANQDAIKKILREAMANAADNIVGVLFDAVADSDLAARTYTVVRQQIPADTQTDDIFLKIVLHCGSDIDPNEKGDSTRPPPEPGEQGGEYPSPFSYAPRPAMKAKKAAKKGTREKKKSKKRSKGRVRKK